MSAKKKPQGAKSPPRLYSSPSTAEEKPADLEESKTKDIVFPDETFEQILTRIARVPKPD